MESLRNISLVRCSQVCSTANDVNGAVNLWTKVFNQMNNNHCPRITKRIKRQKQLNWITNEIVNIMRRRDFGKKRHNKTEYKKLRNKCKLMIRNSKTTFYKETIQKCKNDPRELVNFLMTSELKISIMIK